MGIYSPNKQQQEFIDSSGSNVLVSASAGSGKTSTMITKLVNIISLEKVNVNNLLVVTYTNAAASEIKLKLYDRLSQLIIDTDNVADKNFIKKQLDNLGNAEIGTLHSICKKLIAKYFYDIGESPDFKLLTDKGKESQYLFDMAIKNVFNKHIVAQDEEFFDLYDCYNSKRNDLELKKIILQLYNYKIARTDFSSWVNSFMSGSYETNLDNNASANYILQYYQRRLLGFSNRLLALLNESNREYAKYSACLESRYQFINEFVSLSSFSQAVKVLFGCKFVSKPQKSKTLTAQVAEFDEKVENFNKDFYDVINMAKSDFAGDDIGVIAENLLNAKNNLQKILAILEEVEQEYSVLKHKKNCLDFNDLEDKMIDLLKNEKIKETLMKNYSYVFVDEYQDINEKQEYILSQLVSGDNYYMIGDVKQSIYAFRQSSPKIFISKYKDFLNPNTNDKVINFNENFRSNINILEFANKIFDNLITEGTIGIDYKNDARFVPKNYNVDNLVEFDILDDNAEIKNKEYLEALLIVKRILKLKTLKMQNGNFYDYKDIAIILRKRGSFAKILYDTLCKYQIPVTTTITSDFFTTPEIVLLISILKCVSNYNDDVALVTILKNLFLIDERDLSNIRQNFDNDSFYSCVSNYDGQKVINEKLKSFFEFVRLSKNMLVHLSLREYLMWVINKYDILLKEKSFENGLERENNIYEFLELCDNDNYKYNLEKFLEYLEFVSRDSSTQIVGSSGNAVQICTIHYSKGLEYPAVILGGLGKAFQLNKDSGNIIISNEFGVGIKSINSINRTLNDTIVRSACKISNEQSEMNEEIRLLYVATTRAKENLTLIGSCDLDKYLNHKRKRIYSSKNFFDLIFKCIPDVYDSWFANKQKQFKLFDGESAECIVNIYNQQDIEEDYDENNKKIILNKIDENLVSILRGVFERKIDLESYTVKNTVTNIMKEETDYEVINYEPNRLDETDNLVDRDYLKIGTAYHSIMQSLNYNESKENINNTIDKLIADGVIDREVAQFVNVEEIIQAVGVVGPFVLSADMVMKEKQFILQENYNKLVKNTDNNTKVMIQGVIDLIIIRDGKAIVIDFKTNNTRNETALMNQYRLQLQIYALALEKAIGVKVDEKFLYSFKMGKLIKVI